MLRVISTLFCASLILSGCSQSVKDINDRTAQPCGEKPNCVSTVDARERHHLISFMLTSTATLDKVEEVALQIDGAKTAVKEAPYLRIEYTSKVLRFVDDLEMKIEGSDLVVRSESRFGYSDFGVNRKRVEELRARLIAAHLLK